MRFMSQIVLSTFCSIKLLQLLRIRRTVAKGGGVFSSHATFGGEGAPSLKNTENGVLDGFFLT